MRDYPNVPRAIGAVLSAKMATLRDLSDMGLEDVYDMLEVIQIDAQNAALARQQER